MKKRIIGFSKILKNTFKGWTADDPFRQSASIAFYAIFSLPALLVLIINVVGFFFKKEAITGEISRQIESVMGTDTADQVGEMVKKAGEAKAGLLPGIIAVVTIIFGATGVFAELQKSLDLIWDVKQKPKINFWQKIQSRLFSFGLIISIGFLLLISLIVSTALAAMSHWLEAIFPKGITYLFYSFEFAISLSVISTLFALMFKFLPDLKIPWKNVWVGAVLTGFLFMLGKYGLSIYFGKAQPASVYGAAGSIVLLLLWVSYSSMIVFFGAEFTKQYAVFHNIKIDPTKIAERIDQKDDGKANSKKTEKENKYIRDHEGVGQKKADNKPQKIKSKKHLQEKIDGLEQRLSDDKRGIRDDLKFSHIFGFLVPGRLRVKKKDDEKLTVDDYLRALAENHVSGRPENMIDRLKKLVGFQKDGSP